MARSQAVESVPEVLIIGAGCTGTLTAALLRQKVTQRQLRITVWEWARGPAGRMTSFWTDVGGETALADLGAQVLSVRRADRVPQWLLPKLRPADNSQLAKTTERVETWCHFIAAEGMTSLQQASLEAARPDDVRFMRQVLSLEPAMASATGQRWSASFRISGGSQEPVCSQDFDLIIFAGTAQDALDLNGFQAALSPLQEQALKSVQYDHRLCLALVLEPWLSPIVKDLCQGHLERSFESGPISLIVCQDLKGRACSTACTIVLHSTDAFAAENLHLAQRQNQSPEDSGREELLGALADRLRIPHPQLQAAVLNSKLVHWLQCQTISPAERSESPLACMVAEGAPNLMLAGDYLSKSVGSFEGCLESAESVVEEAFKVLFADESDLSSAM